MSNVLRTVVLMWTFDNGSELISFLPAVVWSHWNDHVLDWWKHKDDPNVLFLKYEDLQKVC